MGGVGATMGLDIFLIALLLIAAFSHAAWNAVLKSSGDRLFTMATVMGMGTLVYGPVLFFVDVPPLHIWPFLITSFLLHLGYFFFISYAYKFGDLSAVYPIARGCSPLMVAGGAALFAGQVLSPLATAGVVVASFGICLFAFERGLPTRHIMKPLMMAFIVSCFIASYTVVDGMGLIRSETPWGYIAWLNFLDGIPMLVYVFLTRGEGYVQFLKIDGRKAAMGGLLAMLAYGLVLYALSVGGMAHVSALRETSVLFAVILGSVTLGEKFGPIRWVAAIAIVAGVTALQIS